MVKPNEITGLKIWLDSEDISLSENSTVSAWNGKGGTVINAVGASGTDKSPTVKYLNKKKYVFFNGAIGQRMDLSQNVFNNNNPMTMFIVMHGLKNGHIIGISTSTTPYYTYLKGVALQGGKYGVSARNNGAGSLIETSNSDYLSKSIQEVLTVTFDNKNTSIKTLSEDKRVDSTNNLGFNNYAKATIGASDGSNSNGFVQPFEGYIGEIIVYDRILSEQEIIAIQTYIKFKWFTVNKSFILSSNGYEEFIKGTAGNVLTYVDTTSGKTYTSDSTYSSHSKNSAFDDNLGFTGSFNGNGWMSTSTSNAWIAVDLGVSKNIKKLSLAQYGYNGAYYRCGSFSLDYSDDNLSWNTAISNTLLNNYQVQYFDVNSGSHRYWRLNIINSPAGGALGIAEIELLEEILGSPPIPSIWKTVSPTLPTLSQFQTEGMDDLSIFDRKVQKVLDSPKVMTDSVLGVGKVYKSSVDLKKIFDLRKLEVK